MYDKSISVFIGRFQPFHNGHLEVIQHALTYSKYLVILVGSSDQPRDYFNPWTFEERKEMIIDSLTDDELDRVLITPLHDHTYNDEKWIIEVQQKVKIASDLFGLGDVPQVTLIGHSKDHSSFYLKKFPQWPSINVQNYRGINSTDIRDAFFNFDDLEYFEKYIGLIPKAVYDYLVGFYLSVDYKNLQAEFDYIEKYKEPYSKLPYPPVFVTTDAICIQSGHVLLIKRKSLPGKDLWAFPGGFINADEWIDNTVIRELREETKIKVPEAVIRGSLITHRKFDNPKRSARGRLITFGYLFKFVDGELPKVKGADDAKKAKWVPISEVKRELMFEDHASILEWAVDFLSIQ